MELGQKWTEWSLTFVVFYETDAIILTNIGQTRLLDRDVADDSLTFGPVEVGLASTNDGVVHWNALSAIHAAVLVAQEGRWSFVFKIAACESMFAVIAEAPVAVS